jgi:hypothetical protein
MGALKLTNTDTDFREQYEKLQVSINKIDASSMSADTARFLGQSLAELQSEMLFFFFLKRFARDMIGIMLAMVALLLLNPLCGWSFKSIMGVLFGIMCARTLWQLIAIHLQTKTVNEHFDKIIARLRP